MLVYFIDETKTIVLLAKNEEIANRHMEEIQGYYPNKVIKKVEVIQTLEEVHDYKISGFYIDEMNNFITVNRVILTTDKTSINSDGLDTATIKSDYICDWFDESGNLIDSQTNIIYVTSLNPGLITIKAISKNNGDESITIEVV